MPEEANSSIPKKLTFVDPTGMYEVSNVVQLSIDSTSKMRDLMYSITSGILLSDRMSGAIGSITIRVGLIDFMYSVILLTISFESIVLPSLSLLDPK